MTNQTLLNDLNERFDELLPFLMELNVKDEANLDEIVQKLKDEYFNGTNIITDEDEQRLIDVK